MLQPRFGRRRNETAPAPGSVGLRSRPSCALRPGTPFQRQEDAGGSAATRPRREVCSKGCSSPALATPLAKPRQVRKHLLPRKQDFCLLSLSVEVMGLSQDSFPTTTTKELRGKRSLPSTNEEATPRWTHISDSTATRTHAPPPSWACLLRL